jgi:hypothetical protein
MRFNPKADATIALSLMGTEVTFSVDPHPDPKYRAVKFPHAMTGDRSTIWHMHVYQSDDEYALKVPNAKYPGRSDVQEICTRLDLLKLVEGLESSDRFCLTREAAAPTIELYAELEYAVLMPWIRGTSWFDAHQDHERTRSLGSLSRWQCLQLGHRLACVLSELESRRIVHCGLCPENLIVDTESVRVEVVGLDDIHYCGATQNGRTRTKLPGYAHPAYSESQVDGAFDRFPGALLLAEILAWFDEKVRGQCGAESYFEPDELQVEGLGKFHALEDAVSQHHPDLARLLGGAWKSAAPDSCPSIQQWRETLERVMLTKIEYAWLRGASRPARRNPRPRCWNSEQPQGHRKAGANGEKP